MNNRWLTAILGAGTLATLYSFRRYLGIVLVLSVATCSFRGPILDYVNTDRDQQHQERMAELQAQNDRLKLQAEQQLKLVEAQAQAEAVARADRLRADSDFRREQLRLLQQQRQVALNEIARITPLRAQLYDQYLYNRQASNWGVANPQWNQIEQYDRYLEQQRTIANRVF